jgi:hypothetical protein
MKRAVVCPTSISANIHAMPEPILGSPPVPQTLPEFIFRNKTCSGLSRLVVAAGVASSGHQGRRFARTAHPPLLGSWLPGPDSNQRPTG